MRTTIARVVWVCALAVALTAIWPAATTHAVTLTVTKTADTNDGVCDADCSLREAVIEANTNGTADDDIVLPNGTFDLTIAGAGEDNAATGDLDIRARMRITNAPNSVVTIRQTTADRVFDVHSLLSIGGIAITGGQENVGGGIAARSGASLAIGISSIHGNRATGTSGKGGGIWAPLGAVVVVSQSNITDNSSTGDGGGAHMGGNWIIRNSTLSGNSAAGQGGAIFIDSTVSGSNTFPANLEAELITVTANSTSGSGGAAVWNGGRIQTIFNSIVGGQTVGANCGGGGTQAAGATNLADVSGCTFTGFFTGTLGLGPLAAQSPSREAVHPINSSTSAARNAGLDCDSLDQRGRGRLIPDGCDLGAYERQPPQILPGSGSATFLAGGPAVNVAPSLLAIDGDGPISGASVRISASFVSAEDRLLFTAHPDITGSYDVPSGVLTLMGTSAPGAYTTVLRSVRYNNLSGTPSTATRTVQFTVSDAVESGSATRNVLISVDVNDPPVNSFNPPGGALAASTNGAIVNLPASFVQVNDPDVGSNQLDVTITFSPGLLTLNTRTGLTFLDGTDGVDEGTSHFRGTQANINNALQSLALAVAPGYTGAATFSIVTNDQGFTGPDGAKTDSDTQNLTIANANDPPSNLLNPPGGTLAAANDGTIVDLPALFVQVSDPDVGSNELDVTISLSPGSMTLTTRAGLTFQGGSDGVDDAVIHFRANQGAANAALASLVLKFSPGYVGPATFQVVTNDQGFSGLGGPKSDTDSVALSVGAGNDPPVHSIAPTGQLAALADGTIVNLPVLFVQVHDPDVGSNELDVRISLTPPGSITLTTRAGLSFLDGSDGVDDAAIHFRGTQTRVNNALKSMVFKAPPGYTGPATINITTDDLGSAGIGGPKSDTDSVIVDIVEANDPPQNIVPSTTPGGPILVRRNTPFVFNAATRALISVADPDTGGSPIRVQLVVGKGVLTLSSTAGLTFESGDGTADAVMRFRGSVTDINAALDGMVYTPNANALDATSLVITTNDLGNRGVGGAKQDQDPVHLRIVTVP
jgi:CSLREA domain-containing protein